MLLARGGRPGNPPNLKVFVAGENLEHAIGLASFGAGLHETKTLSKASMYLSGVYWRGELLELDVAIRKQAESEGFPVAGRHAHADL